MIETQRKNMNKTSGKTHEQTINNKNMKLTFVTAIECMRGPWSEGASQFHSRVQVCNKNVDSIKIIKKKVWLFKSYIIYL